MVLQGRRGNSCFSELGSQYFQQLHWAARVSLIFFGGWAGPGVVFTEYQYIGTERDFWPSKGYGEEFADAKNQLSHGPNC